MKPVNSSLGLTASFLLACLIVGPAGAEDFPPRKPGLWKIDMSVSGTQKPGHQMQMCIDAATDAEMYKFGMSASRGMCDKQEIARSGSTVTVDSTCKLGESRITTHTVIAYDGDTAYRTEAKSKFDPPMMGRSESTTTQDAKWVGPCPADMQPGDMLMEKGMKINIKQMMNAHPGE
jgi:hypothetical protein